MSNHVRAVGVGMVPSVKPGANEPDPEMAAQATRLALADAGIGWPLGDAVGPFLWPALRRPARFPPPSRARRCG